MHRSRLARKRDLTASIRGAAERCETEANKAREAWRIKLSSVKLSSEDIAALHYRRTTDENRRMRCELRSVSIARRMDDLRST